MLHSKVCWVTHGQVAGKEVRLSRKSSRNGGQGHYSLAGEGRELPEERGSERGLVQVLSLSSRSEAPKGNSPSGSFIASGVCHSYGYICGKPKLDAVSWVCKAGTQKICFFGLYLR